MTAVTTKITGVSYEDPVAMHRGYTATLYVLIRVYFSMLDGRASWPVTQNTRTTVFCNIDSWWVRERESER